MSSGTEDRNKKATNISAADQYRAAFLRLRDNTPERVAKGSLVSQNNVAKEAGVDPSALKKSRFPLLVAEIQRYVAEQAISSPSSARQTELRGRQKNRDLRERINAVTEQRDHLASLLSEADATIIELRERIADLERQLPASNVVALDAKDQRRI